MDYIRRNWNINKSIYSYIKRLFDIVFSIIGIITLSPTMILCAILIKLDSKGPVLYKQKRTGKMGKEFTILKFRTMQEDNDVYDNNKKDKPTRIGKILRKTGFDEIPQLFNILSGKMSFIGPRPWLVDYYNHMNEIQRHRVDVTPGITGLAQVKGRNKISINDKIQYDLEYIDDYGLLVDIRTMLLTLKKETILSGDDNGKENIHKEIEELKKSKVYSKNKYN